MPNDQTPIDVANDIPFRTARNEDGADEQLALDVYAPGAAAGAKRPAILWVHGGGFKPQCDKRQGYIAMLCKAYAQKGYVSVASEYRRRRVPSDDRAGTIADAVEDTLAALEWVVAHADEYTIDAARIYLAGGSAGGILTTALLTQYAAYREGRAIPASIPAYINLWGSPRPDEMPAPVTPEFPPTILIHGTDDQAVAFERAERFLSELQTCGVTSQLFPIQGAGHTPAGRRDEFIPQIDAFMNGL